jgi:hypothetical protein
MVFYAHTAEHLKSQSHLWMSSRQASSSSSKKKERKRPSHHSSKPPPGLYPQPVDPLENELRRLPLWAHESLEDTDDPFADDFTDDVTSPGK